MPTYTSFEERRHHSVLARLTMLCEHNEYTVVNTLHGTQSLTVSLSNEHNGSDAIPSHD